MSVRPPASKDEAQRAKERRRHSRLLVAPSWTYLAVDRSACRTRRIGRGAQRARVWEGMVDGLAARIPNYQWTPGYVPLQANDRHCVAGALRPLPAALELQSLPTRLTMSLRKARSREPLSSTPMIFSVSCRYGVICIPQLVDEEESKLVPVEVDHPIGSGFHPVQIPRKPE